MSKLAHSTTWTVFRAPEGHIVTIPDSADPLTPHAELLGFGLWVQDAITVATSRRDSHP